MNIKQKLKQNFLDNLIKGSEDECWEYPHKNNNGYGQLQACETLEIGKYKRHHRYAHRMAYELFKGPVPEGLNVCHHCDNPPCCNPAHLFAGTDDDNHKDKVSKGRQTRGESHGGSKLTEDVVRKLKSGELKPSRKLARELGLADASHLYGIRNGKYWKHVK